MFVFSQLSKCQETDLPSLPIKRKNFRFLSGFFNLLLSRFILKFFRFFLTILVTADTYKVLLLRTSFVISVLFGDVETEKLANSVTPADKISLNFPSIKIFHVFCQKEEDLPLLFHKMLEGLQESHGW